MIINDNDNDYYNNDNNNDNNKFLLTRQHTSPMTLCKLIVDTSELPTFYYPAKLVPCPHNSTLPRSAILSQYYEEEKVYTK